MDINNGLDDPINVEDIVRDYLIAKNYDGLLDINNNCRCNLDSMFVCADYRMCSCVPFSFARKNPVSQKEKE